LVGKLDVSLTGEVLIKFIGSLEKQLDTLKKGLDFQQIEEFIEVIEQARYIFVMGAGRSGYIAKAFAMRLMHLGYDVYVVGETVTPRIGEEDVLISISGSGETASVVNISKKAKEIGSKLVAITYSKNSTLAKLSDVVVVRSAKVKTQNDDEELARLAPLGTMFELTALILLDGLIAELMSLKGLKEEDLLERHAVLE
jgi:6-phospho-3-hexuloisomerase